MGWAALEAPVGVIEIAPGGVDRELLDCLNARFPDRRWVEGVSLEPEAPRSNRARAA